MQIGIIGLEQSGKTTLFNALTSSSGDIATGPGAKKEAHLSNVKVPDPRLDRLHELYPTAKKTPATIEYLDVGGLARGSTQRKGFIEQFLASLRNVDALLCVLRIFENESVAHPEGDIDPRRDWRIIEEEFFFADMAILEGRMERLRSELKKIKKPELQKELDLLERCFAALESETPLRQLELTPAEEKSLRGFQFLTAKPVLLVLNIDEEKLARESEVAGDFSELADSANIGLVSLSAKLEAEIAGLPEEEQDDFRRELGIEEPALNKMIRSSYALLNLISFFTVGEKDVRAWTIKKGTRAQLAAGEIHSDIERGFIRAEVVDYENLNQLGSWAKCRDQGVLRLEGKEYIVQDGDVITFRFNI